jgi:hypothetical protein
MAFQVLFKIIIFVCLFFFFLYFIYYGVIFDRGNDYFKERQQLHVMASNYH